MADPRFFRMLSSSSPAMRQAPIVRVYQKGALASERGYTGFGIPTLGCGCSDELSGGVTGAEPGERHRSLIDRPDDAQPGGMLGYTEIE